MLTSLRVLLGGSRLGDLPSFKAIRVEVLETLETLETLEMREMTHGWTVEMVVKAARADLRIAQVSINYRPRLAGRSKVSGTIRGSLRAAMDDGDLRRALRALDTAQCPHGGGSMKRPDGVVYVVAKAPQPGVSKTRLCPPLTPDQASQVACAFLHDTLANATLAGVTPRIVCRTASEQHELRRLVGALTQVSMQSGAGLGDALVSAFRDG